MLLSVIIPTYKRRDALLSCLDHLAPGVQTISPELFEVVVTDDEAGGDTGQFLAETFPWARYNRGPQKGPASNRNSGAHASTGEWILFLDDDCLPQPEFLAAYVKAIQEHPDYRVFEGSTLADRPQERLDEESPINDKGGYLWSCNFLIARDVFLEIGGFCELYPYACMEDVDLREELKKRGIKFLFTPEARVIHPWRALVPDDKFLKTRIISHAIFYDRHPSHRPSLVLTLRVIFRQWILFLFVDAPRRKFRGFARFFARQKTMSQFQFQNWAGRNRKQV